VDKDNWKEDKLNFTNTMDALKHYLKVRMELFEIESKDYFAKVIVSFVVLFSILGLLLVFLFFFSLAGAFLLNDLFSSAYVGFLIMAALIVLFGVLIYVFRGKLITGIVYRVIFERDIDVFKDLDE